MDNEPNDAEAIAALDAFKATRSLASDSIHKPSYIERSAMRYALDAASAWRKARADEMPWPDT